MIFHVEAAEDPRKSQLATCTTKLYPGASIARQAVKAGKVTYLVAPRSVDIPRAAGPTNFLSALFSK